MSILRDVVVANQKALYRGYLAALGEQVPGYAQLDHGIHRDDLSGLLRAIRGAPALRLLPVILLSARAGEEATAEGLGAGANDYIAKPLDVEKLLSLVRVWMPK